MVLNPLRRREINKKQDFAQAPILKKALWKGREIVCDKKFLTIALTTLATAAITAAGIYFYTNRAE